MQVLNTLKALRQEVVRCHRCPRLVAFREQVPARASFKDENYWRKPVPGYGDPNAWLLIVGLAPSAHGGNRTGRIFTGDESARFLMKNLFEEGFTNQPTSLSADDGLQMIGCYMTAAVKCVPPENMPTRQEVINCNCYLKNEFHLLKIQSVLALGKLSFDTIKGYLKELGIDVRGLSFAHGARFSFKDFPTIYCSYHPSPQNTNTGKLTDTMFREVLKTIRKERQL